MGPALARRERAVLPSVTALGRALEATGLDQALTFTLIAALRRAVRLEGSPGTDPQRVQVDLSALGPGLADWMTPAVGACLDQVARTQGLAVTDIVLPPGVTRLPPGLAAMKSLSVVQLPSFEGTYLDLRPVETEAKALQVVIGHARQLCRVDRWPQQAVEVRSSSHQKIQLRTEGRSAGGDQKGAGVQITNLKGRHYLRVDRTDHPDIAAYLKDLAETQAIDLNCQVPFKGTTDLIVCRHLALAALYHRLKHEAASGTASAGPTRWTYQNFSSAERIQATVDPQWEQAFALVLTGATRNVLVHLSRLNDFLQQEFEAMSLGTTRYFQLASPTHVMSVRLRLKQQPGEEPVRVFELADPNSSGTHVRKAVTHPAALQVDLDAVLAASGQTVSHYFGQDAAGQMALLQEVTLADIEAARAGRRPAEAAGRPRGLEVWRGREGRGARVSPHEVGLRLGASLGQGLVEGLVEALVQASGPQAQLDLLRGVRLDGWAFLPHAMAQADEGIVIAVAQAAVRAGLAEGLRLGLVLRGESASEPLITELIKAGQPGPIRRLFDVMKTLDLSPESLLQVLQAPNGQGLRALDLALPQGRDLTRLLLDLVNSLDLPRTDRVKLLNARRPDGLTSLQAAVRDGAVSGVDGWLSSILESNLTDPQKHAVLVPPGGESWMRTRLLSQPALAALWADRLATPSFYDLSLILTDALRDGKSQASAAQALGPYDEFAQLDRLQGREGLDDQPAFVRRLHTVLRSPSSIDAKQATLGQVDGEGRSLLYRLMAAGASGHVDQLAQVLTLPAFALHRPALLLAWNPVRGISALNRALETGQMAVVQVWMARALTLCQAMNLEPEVRVQLLRGLPPDAAQPARERAERARQAGFAALTAWAKAIAQAGPHQLDSASKRALLEPVGKLALLSGSDHQRPGSSVARPG